MALSCETIVGQDYLRKNDSFYEVGGTDGPAAEHVSYSLETSMQHQEKL